MVETLINLSTTLAMPTLVAVTLFALLKGGPAERVSAPALLATGIGLQLFRLLPGAQPQYPSLICDAVVAFLFLWFALRYSNLWLAAAMICQGLGFGLHVLLLEQTDDLIDRSTQFTFVIGMHLTSWSVMLLIAGGTFAAWGRRLGRRPKVRPPEPALAG